MPKTNSENKMKVVMVDALVGNDYSLCLCSSLQAAGMDVRLVVTEDRSENTRVPLTFPLLKWSPSKDPAQNKFTKTLKYFRYLTKLWREFGGNKPDIVHFQFFRRERIESIFFVFLRLLQINLVYTAHDVFPPEKKRLDFLIKSLVYRSAKTIIVHSNYLKRMIVKTFGIDGQKINVVPHGNFDNYLPEQSITKAQARKKLKIAANSHALLFFGIIREYKGLGLLLDAFEKAAKKNADLRLIIAGSPLNDELKKRYEIKINAMAAKNRVLYHAHFIPNDDVAAYFTAADAVVLPYRNIYHSGVLHLAYSFGKPVIATKVGDFPETIEHDKTGFLVDTIHEQALAMTLLEAFSDTEALEQMGQNAREQSETKYSWENVARQTWQAYATLAKHFCAQQPQQVFSPLIEKTH